MEDEEFQSHKESLIATKQGMPNSLFEDSERYWEQIWNRRYVVIQIIFCQLCLLVRIWGFKKLWNVCDSTVGEWGCRYFFDANRHEAGELMQVSKKELINWCRRFLGPRSRLRRHLCLHVVGLNAQDGDVDDPIAETSNDVKPRRTVLIECLDKFKKNLEVYPVRL